MILNAQMTEIKTLPGVHNHEDDAEEIAEEKFRQKLKKVQRDPTQLLKQNYDFA